MVAGKVLGARSATLEAGAGGAGLSKWPITSKSTQY